MQSTTTTVTTQNDVRNSLSDRINADLLLNGRHQHQHDLFTGSLGIPDVTTHVGSVIHAFETMARTHDNKNLIYNGEQPYELYGKSSGTHTTGRKILKKSDSNKLFTNNTSKQQSRTSFENRQRFAIPTPPPPPALPPPPSFDALLMASMDSETVQMPTSENVTQSIQLYHTHTLPHAHAVQQLHQNKPTTTGTQTIRIGDGVVSRSGGDGNGIGITNNGFVRGIGGGRESGSGSASGIGNRSSSNKNNNSSNNAIGMKLENSKNELNNLDSINMDDDYRKKLFGSHPKIDSKLFHSTVANAATDDNINFREFELKQKPMQTKKSDNFSINRIFQNRNSKLRGEQANPSSKRNSDSMYLISSSNEKNTNFPMSDFSQVNSRYLNRNNQVSNLNDDDDQQFLRGSTVSQSFIKNIRNSTRKVSDNSSASNGFKAVKHTKTVTNPMHQTNADQTAGGYSYYKPQKYVLSDDYGDELRARYTEHSEHCDITLAAKKNQSKSYKPSKQTGFNYKRQK